MSATVTIGIPCWNSARWLGAAIESALAQTWPHKEVVVVDDGSTDESRAVAQRFGDRIRLVESDNRGGNHARNLVVSHSTGDWLQFLDADDYLEPEKIERQFAEVEVAAADVIYSPVVEENGVGTETRREPSLIDTSVDLYAQWLAWEIPQTGGALWRRTALAAIGGWKKGQPCCQEHELYLRALQAGHRFVFAPSALAIYRIWSADTVCRRDPRLVIRVKTVLIDEMRGWLMGRNLWTPVHQRIAGRACFEMARSWAKYDRDAADQYHRERQAKQLIHLEGPAAPMSYQIIYRTLGFSTAERLAAASR